MTEPVQQRHWSEGRWNYPPKWVPQPPYSEYEITALVRAAIVEAFESTGGYVDDRVDFHYKTGIKTPVHETFTTLDDGFNLWDIAVAAIAAYREAASGVGAAAVTTTAQKTPIRVVVEAITGKPDPSIPEIDAAYPVANRITNALIAAGHLPIPACGDCGVAAGELHVSGCSVARCKLCGWQDIGDHHCAADRPSTTWTGRWPGEAEVEEYSLPGANELYSLAMQGGLRWSTDDERWLPTHESRPAQREAEQGGEVER